jgi:hypothetical protein
MNIVYGLVYKNLCLCVCGLCMWIMCTYDNRLCICFITRLDNLLCICFVMSRARGSSFRMYKKFLANLRGLDKSL